MSQVESVLEPTKTCENSWFDNVVSQFRGAFEPTSNLGIQCAIL